MCRANELLAAKSLSISKLLALCPPGTVDPTPHMYDTNMYALAGMMAIATVSHAMVRPTQKVVIDNVGTVVKPDVHADAVKDKKI